MANETAVRHFNGLTPAEAERLALLAEECAEVIQVVGKILRHGYESSNPLLRVPEDQLPTTNRTLLTKEMGQLQLAMEMIVMRGDIDPINVVHAKQAKAETIDRWLHHNHTLDSEPAPEPQPIRPDARRCYMCGNRRDEHSADGKCPKNEPQPRRRCVPIPSMVLTSNPLQYRCANCGGSWPTDQDAPYCEPVDAPAREPDAPRRWIVEETGTSGSGGGFIWLEFPQGAYVRMVRQLEPLTDDDERDERLAKVIEDVDRDYSGSETISKRLRVRIARAVIAEYAAILGGKEG